MSEEQTNTPQDEEFLRETAEGTVEEQRSDFLDSLAEPNTEEVTEPVEATPEDDEPPVVEAAEGNDAEPPAEQAAEPPVEQPVEQAEEVPVQTATTPYIPPVREDAEARIEAINTEIEEIARKFDEAEEDPGVLLRQNNALLREQSEIQSEIRAAEQAVAAAQHSQAQLWTAAQARFREANPEYWEDKGKLKELDATVKYLANTSDPGVSDDEILANAKQFMELRAQMADKPGKEQEEKPAVDTTPSVKDVASKKVEDAASKPPISLSDVPGGLSSGKDEFEAVMGKPPGDMLDQVMTWSEDKREKWLDRNI